MSRNEQSFLSMTPRFAVCFARFTEWMKLLVRLLQIHKPLKFFPAAPCHSHERTGTFFTSIFIWCSFSIFLVYVLEYQNNKSRPFGKINIRNPFILKYEIRFFLKPIHQNWVHNPGFKLSGLINDYVVFLARDKKDHVYSFKNTEMYVLNKVYNSICQYVFFNG